MIARRIGEVLEEMGKLTPHDVDEILAEQRASCARFGTLAVSMGLCDPQHVWAAWCAQDAPGLQHVDLDDLGVDAQAIERFPPDLARSLRAVPLRLCNGKLILAIDDPACTNDVMEAARRLKIEIKCVLAPALQIERALRQYYTDAMTA